jgi:S-adenosylmethionine-dependent methyltransferase
MLWYLLLDREPSREWHMTKMATNADDGRFRNGAEKYADYLKTAEGRLRLDLAFRNLEDFLPQAHRPLLALDLGGGTGATAVRLARLGRQVTLLDSSLPMLEVAEPAAREAEVTNRIALKHGDAAQFEDLAAGSFDVILCHNILEYVDNPCAVLRGAARALRGSSAIVSVLVRNQAGEVVKAAIQAGDLAAAEHNLTAEWGHESLYGGQGAAIYGRRPASYADSSVTRGNCRAWCTGHVRLFGAAGFPQC